jgi:type II secretory pathway pseudopilin PulG
MIELLTVIAIIAILSAIIVPVFARAKDSAYRNSDIAHMNEIRSALQLYRVDQGAYPPALLGYVTLYSSGPNMGQVIPANQLRGFLYTKRLPSLETLRPAHNRVGPALTTNAVWPNQDPRAIGAAPFHDADGDGDVDGNDDFASARQLYGPSQVVRRWDTNPASPTFGQCIDAAFYEISGYDVSRVPTAPVRVELRYTLFWSEWGYGTDPSGCPLGAGHASDDPRQLGYDDPPETAIVTWNSYFRHWHTGTPDRQKRDLVLLLGGGARPADSLDMHERSWRHVP